MISQSVKLYADIDVTVIGVKDRVSYGVAGSPTWDEKTPDHVYDVIEIMGVQVKMSELPEKLQSAIRLEAFSNVCDLSWTE